MARPDHDSPPSPPFDSVRISRDELVDELYNELRSIASGYMTNERANHTLGPTALVHEAYLRLADQRNLERSSPATLRAAAVRIMRRILIDSGRAKKTDKRGRDWKRVTISGLAHSDDQFDYLALEDALAKLEARDARLGLVVELRFFGGLTVAQTAHELGVSPETVARDWRLAKAFLGRELSRDEHATDEPG